jgi:RND family efflux transporter MFP subunit
MTPLDSEAGKTRLGVGQLLLTAAAIILGVSAWVFFDQAEIPPAARDTEPVSRVVLEPAGMRSFDVSLSTVGRVRPWREVFLAPDVSGRVEEVLVEIGERVERGETLLRIERAPYEDAVREREADLLRSQARSEEASANLQRMAQLRGRGGISEREYDAAVAEERAGQADVRAAEAALARAQRNLQDTGLVAPFAGTIVEREVDPGALIGADRGVLVLSDLDTVAIEAGLTEQELLQVRQSRTAWITSASLPGFVAEGTIAGIAERADPATGTYAVRIRVDNRGQPSFLGGMVVNIDISVRRIESAVAVPEAAVLEAGSNPHIYVVESGRAQKVPVRVVARSEGVLAVEGTLMGIGDNGTSGAPGSSSTNGAIGTNGSMGTNGDQSTRGDNRLRAGAGVVVVGQSILRHGDAVEVVGAR